MLNEIKRRNRNGRDRGMTLPELLIVVSITGILATVVAAAVTVSYRTVTGTEGRVNVARAEQAIDTWLPADLTSTDVTDTSLPAVDDSPGATPCGNPTSCDGVDMSGVNALQLAWRTLVDQPAPNPPLEVITRVQYQYIQKGDEWVMERVECGSPCTSVTVLHDLTPPPFEDIPAWLANPTKPDWVMGVTVPNDPEELDLSTNARRILVTIDGGGNVEGAGGGTNNISLTAGGTTTSEIEADEFNVPSFVRANSRCGGPVALIVDDSGSIGSDVGIVEDGVKAFIEAFRGTPTQLQIIPFSSEAHSMGPGSQWARIVDMTDDAAVTALKNDVDAELVANGGTNWEDAFFRAFHNSDGTEADTKPNRIVFFTDGVVTRDRTSGSSYRSGPLMHYNAGEYNHSIWNSATGSHFSQESWDRTDAMLAHFDRGADFEMIVVGVGQGLTQMLQNKSGYWPQGKWRQNTAAYTNPSAPVGPTIEMDGSETLARILGAGGSAVEAIYDEGLQEFTNPDTADFYNIAEFDLASFGAAMKAAALKDCGGTVTIQTKLTSGTNVPEEFIYENTEYRDHTGAVVPAESRRVTTSAAFRTGTFDFEIPSTSNYFTVDIVPQELETLQGFTFQNWTCKAGGVDKASTGGITSIPIDGSAYEGIAVDVLPNEAVSCIMTVSQP